MRKIETLFRVLDAPLHYVEDDDLQVGDVLDGFYHGAPLRVKVIEVRDGREKHTLGEDVLGIRDVRMCVVVRPREANRSGDD